MANIRRQQHQRHRLNDVSEAFEEAFGDGPNLAEAESEANPQDAAAPAPAAANNNQHQGAPAPRRRHGRHYEIHHRVLVHFMRYLHGVQYDFNHQFSTRDLQAITPSDVERYFKFKTYGNCDADPDLEIPRIGAQSLRSWKKSISYFMRRNSMQWNEVTQDGNPTKSPIIQNLIRTVQRRRLEDASDAFGEAFGNGSEEAGTSGAA